MHIHIIIFFYRDKIRNRAFTIIQRFLIAVLKLTYIKRESINLAFLLRLIVSCWSFCLAR